MKKWKRAMALVLTALVLLCGCTRKEEGETVNGGETGGGDLEQSQSQEQPGNGMGRYLESEVESAEEFVRPAGLVRKADGSLALLDYEKGLYLSRDNGDSWEEGESKSFLELSQDNYVLASSYAPDGNMALAYVPRGSVGEDGKLNPIYVLIDPEGNQKELSIQCDSTTEYLSQLWYMGEGMLYGQGFGENVYQISETDGSLKKVLDMKLVHMTAMGEKLLLTHQEGFSIYDPATGELTEDDVLNDFFKKNMNGVDMLSSDSSYPLLVTGSEDGQTVYLTCRDGIYSHVLGGSLMELAVDGTMVSLGDPRCAMVAMSVTDTGEFLVLTFDGLFRYTYDPDIAAVPEKQLQVYSLREHLLLRQAITLYQKQHPEVYVKYTVGMDENSGVTREDALKTLNTQIAAGSGPDLLLLDGLPVDSYIEKGILADLSQWLAPMEGELYTNVTNIYREESAVYAVPVKFVVPVILGSQDTVNAAKDMGSLADQFEALRGQYPTGKIAAAYTAEEMLNLLGIYDSWEWTDENGQVDEAALEMFLNEAKRIWQAEKSGLSEQALQDHDVWVKEWSAGGAQMASMGHSFGFYMYADTNASYYQIKDHRLVLGFLTGTGINLGQITEAMKAVGQSEYRFLSGRDGALFLPMVCMGINSGSTSQELAGELLQTILSEENLKVDYTDGFSVNRKALERQSVNEQGVSFGGSIMSEDGTEYNLAIEWPSEEACGRLMEQIEELGCPVTVEGTLWDAVMDTGVKVLEGEMTASEGVREIVKKTAIEMAE